MKIVKSYPYYDHKSRDCNLSRKYCTILNTYVASAISMRYNVMIPQVMKHNDERLAVIPFTITSASTVTTSNAISIVNNMEGKNTNPL